MSVTAAVAGSGCCCDTDCDCTEYATLTVSWDGSITLFAECIDPTCNDSASWSLGAVTINSISVTVTRVEAKGFCRYEGQDVVATVTMVNCDDPATTVVMDATAIAEITYNAFFSRWEVRLILAVGPTALADPYCGGSGAWHYLDLIAFEPGDNPDYPSCPSIDDYTDSLSASCYPGSFFSYAICVAGDGSCCSVGMPHVSAYTAGTISVSV
jgi:hypothetical protein